MEINKREYIVKRVAKEFKDGEFITLGIGLPTLCANFIEKNITVTIQSENGIINSGAYQTGSNLDNRVTDAGGNLNTVKPGGAFFDSIMSFTMIRGGHIDTCVLGTLQVDELGNIANYYIPGKHIVGMGGAMDLAVGAKKIIIATEHVTKDGKPKILKRCDMPLTAIGVANLIVTDLAVISVETDGLHLKEIAPHSTIDEIITKTEPHLIIDC